MRGGGDVDDAGLEGRGAGGEQGGQEELEEEEVAEVVGAELGFEPIDGSSFWRVANACL